MANLSKIGRGTTIVGNIRGDGHLDIEGRVEGSLDVHGDVTLSEGSRIKSNVRGGRVTVRGAVAGDISASDAIVLEDGARVVGDLSAPSIGIRPGGLLRGHVSTDPSLGKPARQERHAPAVREAPVRQAPAAREVREVAPPRESQPGRSTSQRTTPRAPEPPPRKEEKREVVEAPKLIEPIASPLTKASAAAKPLRGAPAPVMPALQKGAKGALKKKGAT